MEGASVPGHGFAKFFSNNASTCSSIWDQRHATRADAAEEMLPLPRGDRLPVHTYGAA